MPMQVADAFVRLVIDEKDLQRAVSSSTGPAAVAGGAAGQTVGQRFSKAFTTSTVIAGAAAGAVFAGAIGGAVNFEDQLRTINTVAHLTDAELKGVGSSILDLSKETGKTTDDLTAGFYDLVSAGVPASKAIDVLRASAKFATGALGTTGEAVDLVTSAMNAYGLGAEDATKITDVFAQAVNDGKVTAAELGASIANIAPIAASAGIKLEEVSAGFALLTAKGVPAAQAATQMRAAISGLLTPNEELNRIQKETGINFAELAKAKGLAVALEELRKATHGNADAFARSLGSIEAYQFALASTGENTGAFATELGKTTNALENGGVAQAQYDERMKSAKAQGDKMLASIHALGVEIGGPFVELLGPAVSVVGSLGQGLHGLFLLSSGLGGLLGKVLGGAWTRVAGSGVVKALIARAGSAAATAYLASLIAGDGIAKAISGAWSAVTNSSLVTSATSNAGKFLGSTLGKFAAVAFAAVLVFEAIQTYNRIKDELGKQGADIGQHVGEEIATGTTDALEQSKAALQEGIAKLGQVRDFGLFSGDAKRNLEKQLADVDAELQKRHTESWAQASIEAGQRAGAGFGTGLASTTSAVGTKVTEFVGKIKDDIEGASLFAEAGRRQGNLAGAGVSQGIFEKRALVDQAWLSLLDAIKNAQSPAKEQARLLGHLASKELVAGLHSNDPAVRAQARATKQIIIDRLTELGASTKSIGKTGMEELRKAMRSKDPEIRAAATAIFNSAKKPIAKLPAEGTKAGRGVGRNLVSQLDDERGPVGSAAGRLGRAIARNILGGILYGGTSSAKTGKDDRVPGYDVGTSFVPRDMVARIHQGEIIVPPAESKAIRAGEAALTGSGGWSGGGGGTTNIFNVAIEGLVRARDQLEIAREMRRVASFAPAIAKTRPSYTRPMEAKA